MMRPHGRARIDARSPSALGVCDRCGFLYNHSQLAFQRDWRGPRLQDLRILVCPTCYDKPQENGQRTIVLPQDPVPIPYPRPELYTTDDNPVSTLNYDPADAFNIPSPQRGGNVGNMIHCGGVNAAFDSNSNKRFEWCAALVNSNSSFGNVVGKNWNPDMQSAAFTSLVASSVARTAYTATQVTLYAPNDQPFLSTGPTSYLIEGSSDGATSWTTLASGTTVGTTGEILTIDSLSPTAFSFHRVNFMGDGISPIGVAQFIINATPSETTPRPFLTTDDGFAFRTDDGQVIVP